MDKTTLETIVQASRPVRWAATAALVLLAIFLLIMAIDGMHNWGHPDSAPTNTITVTGDGQATAVPDTATISFTAQATAADVATAETDMTNTVNSALSGVRSAGVSSDDITTTDYSVSPHYTNSVCPPVASGVMIVCPSSQTTSGYDVSETVQVKITDTSKVATILGALAKANVQNVSGPDFVVGDPQSVMQQARAQAIQKAQQDAQVLAKQLGVHLGKIVSFTENTNGSAPQPMFSTAGNAMAAVATPTVPVGQNEYTDSVSVTYEIH